MTDRNGSAESMHRAHEEDPTVSELENFGEETNNSNDVVAKVATVAVVGAGVALISAELIPGMLIGIAAACLPGIGPKLRPLFRSTVRAGYSAVRKTREMMAEASEQVKDVVAEARADHEAETEATTVGAAAAAAAGK
jgi:hypothetical protein